VERYLAKRHEITSNTVLICYGNAEPYDHDNDPGEWHNVAADPANADRINQMRAAVAEAWKSDVVTDDPPIKTKGK
jgi:hypothetical protein